MADAVDVAVIGAGISGLTLAFHLQKRGARVAVLEAADRPGGAIGSRHEDGFLVEAGPNSMLETTPLIGDLVREVGLEHQLLVASPAAKKRFILRDGRLTPLPMSPGAFLGTRLFSAGAKLRLFREPFVKPPPPSFEETVAQFVRRRLGEEFLDYAINPFVAGVYAGDPERLSARAAFPKLVELEQRYGSLIRGQIKGARERRARADQSKQTARMLSFWNGMQSLTDAVAAKLADVRVATPVVGLAPLAQGGFLVRCNPRHGGAAREVHARAVVVAVPAYAAAALVAPLSAAVARELEAIVYPPVASAVFGFRRSSLKHPLDGFGFLVPAVEHRRILGTIFSSTLFPNRAPEHHVALTTFVGGMRQPDLATSNEEAVSLTVRAELKPLLKVKSSPVMTALTCWERAIPQYELGHLDRMERIAALERDHPGLAFCANWRGGISVGDCVKSAASAAAKVADYLAVAPPLPKPDATTARGGETIS
jgi:oxygen-dependent protoporphyrinogen oxidase